MVNYSPYTLKHTRVSKDKYYREVVEQTVAWLRSEMLHESGGFFSALDADSEGEEVNSTYGRKRNSEGFSDLMQNS